MARSKSIYRRLKDIWQLMPPGLNDRLRRAPLVGALVRKVADATVKGASHQEIYDARYYGYVDSTASESAVVMAETIIRHFQPKRILDVGCGTGALLHAFNRKGVSTHGLEYSNAGIEHCRAKGVSVTQFDLEAGGVPGNVGNDFDLTVSFEVAEHLPEGLADRYVEVITRGSRFLVITAATPGQGGLDHVNEQPHAYWIARIRQRGYTYLEERSLQLRKEWKQGGAAKWYANNAMVFQRQQVPI